MNYNESWVFYAFVIGLVFGVVKTLLLGGSSENDD